MSAGGEELGTITFRVVDAGNAVVQSPGGVAAGRMPSQAPQLPTQQTRVTAVERSAPSTRYSAAGVASVISQSTTAPFSAAVGAAGMVGGASVAGPLMIVGAAAVAVGGAFLALRGSIRSLVSRIEEVGRFAPGTMQAMMAERVASFQRQIYRARTGDAAFAGLQRQLTRLSNLFTPLVSMVERIGATLLTKILSGVERIVQSLAQVLNIAGVAMSTMPGALGMIGRSVSAMAQAMLNAQNMGAHPNQIFQQQLNTLTSGRAFAPRNPYGGFMPGTPPPSLVFP